MSEPLFAQSDIHELAAAIRTAYEGSTPAEREASMYVAITKLAVKTARAHAVKLNDHLARRLDVAETQIRARDEQLQRHKEHLQRLQTKVATLELLAKGGR